MKATFQFTYKQPEDLQQAYNELFDLVYGMRKAQIQNTRQSIQKKKQDNLDEHINNLIVEKEYKL